MKNVSAKRVESPGEYKLYSLFLYKTDTKAHELRTKSSAIRWLRNRSWKFRFPVFPLYWLCGCGSGFPDNGDDTGQYAHWVGVRPSVSVGRLRHTQSDSSLVVIGPFHVLLIIWMPTEDSVWCVVGPVQCISYKEPSEWCKANQSLPNAVLTYFPNDMRALFSMRLLCRHYFSECTICSRSR